MPDIDNLAVFFLKHAIKRVNEGYGVYGLEAAFYAAMILRDGEDLPEEARLYLAEALEKISLGGDPSAALKLNGRKKEETLEKEIGLAKAAYHAIKAGHGVDATFGWIAEHGVTIVVSVGALVKIHASKEQIRAAYYKHKLSLEQEKG